MKHQIVSVRKEGGDELVEVKIIGENLHEEKNIKEDSKIVKWYLDKLGGKEITESSPPHFTFRRQVRE